MQPPGGNGVRSIVRPPAVALIVVAGLSLFLSLLSLLFDGLLLISGVAADQELQTLPISKQTQIIIRTIWGIGLALTTAFVLNGAILMYKLENYTLARTAAIVAMIPLLSPCCLLGIPFGIWAFVVLRDPRVERQFR